MNIIGLTLVRNESLIIQETLDHFGRFCTGGIYVLDDCSDDDTYEIAKSHKSVVCCERVPQKSTTRRSGRSTKQSIGRASITWL